MKAWSLLVLALWQAGASQEPPVATPEYMRYQRVISVPAGPGQACAVLDATVFPHAAPSLADLRLFPAGAGARELPYVITMSQTATDQTQTARVLNLGTAAASTLAFDLEMPQRPYTDVVLQIDPDIRDFIATAKVTGSPEPGGKAAATSLGTFTLFDLTSQGLSRVTTLPLVESTFPYLHIVLTVSAAPGAHTAASSFAPEMVQGAEVPPSREAQVLYTTVAETTTVRNLGRHTEAILTVPARVPSERVSFVLAPEFKGNFSRAVRVTAVPADDVQSTSQARLNGSDSPASHDASQEEDVSGEILRVRTREAGHDIRTEELAIPAILGANLQHAATVRVTVDNGDDQPLPITAVRLEMRQRKLCFVPGAEANAGLSLFYGDSRLLAPQYDYQRLFRPAENVVVATLGSEMPNPLFRDRASARKPFTERHPEVLWLALVGVVCALGSVALRSSRHIT